MFSNAGKLQASKYMRFSVLLLMNFWIYLSEDDDGEKEVLIIMKNGYNTIKDK